MNEEKILKFLLILGGVIEIVIGILLMFVDIFLNMMGYECIPLFNQFAGTFLFGFGILLIISSKDIRKFIIIPIVNILLRMIMVAFSLINLGAYMMFLPVLLFAFIYDPLWSILMVIFLKKGGFLSRSS